LLVLAISDARDVVRRRGKKIARLPADLSHWEELAGFGIPESDIPVAKYRSKLTGLTIAVARAETPIVNGYFCLPTEAHDNDGLPHTLEHLIFMGSEDYPYKEVLDLLANRCLASRTNAWTAVDHTCYTVTPTHRLISMSRCTLPEPQDSYRSSQSTSTTSSSPT